MRPSDTRLIAAATTLVAALWAGEARAQAPSPGSHFNRTTSGGESGAATAPARAPGRRGSAVERTSAAARVTADPLAPYTSRPRGTSTGTPLAPPPERPPAPAAPRNYFPNARSGQVRHHCTPSRAAVQGFRR